MLFSCGCLYLSLLPLPLAAVHLGPLVGGLGASPPLPLFTMSNQSGHLGTQSQNWVTFK